VRSAVQASPVSTLLCCQRRTRGMYALLSHHSRFSVGTESRQSYVDVCKHRYGADFTVSADARRTLQRYLRRTIDRGFDTVAFRIVSDRGFAVTDSIL
jgi:hypothetical protein